MQRDEGRREDCEDRLGEVESGVEGCQVRERYR